MAFVRSSPSGRRRTRSWPRRVALAGLMVGAVALTVATFRIAQETQDGAAALEATKDRVSGLEEQLVAQSVDTAAAETELRILRGQVAEVAESIEEQPDVPAVTRRVLKSVFTVETAGGSGSAFVVTSSDGASELVTNAHVIADVWNNGGRGVELVQGERRLSATISDVSFTHDLALLSVRAELPALTLTKPRADAGSPVLVIGSPLGLEGSVVSGVVSSYRVEEGQEQLQISAPVNPGNSGGPVTDVDGDVLGVIVAKYVGFEIEGLSFAVPTDVLCATFEVCE